MEHRDRPGQVIGIVNVGVEHTHPDLVANYDAADSWDFGNNDPDPAPYYPNDDHGTAVAGLAAATGNNGIGVSGVAPNAAYAGLRWDQYTANDAMLAEALSYHKDAINVYNNSWGLTGTLTAPQPLTSLALKSGTEGIPATGSAAAVNPGRSGLGSIYVFAAGNGAQDLENANYDDYGNSRYVIDVGALDSNGQAAYYSEPGACLLVSAYADDVTTTDRMGDNGYNYAALGTTDYADRAYTAHFNGTSAAAPQVSGVVALMLQANPNLTWRDVPLILATTAKRNDPTDPGWSQNGAGLWVNDKFGFGAVDAAAAVNAAKTWKNVGPELTLHGAEPNLNMAIPGDTSPDGITRTITLGDDIGSIERVEVTVNISMAQVGHTGDLDIELVAPDGTTSQLSAYHVDPTNSGFNNWTFTTTRDIMEASGGNWSLVIKNATSTVTGTLKSWSMNVYGSEGTRAPS